MALLWVSTVAIVFAVYGGNVSLIGFLAIAPFIAAAFARPSRVLIVGLLAAFFALVISTPPHSYGELNHTLRVVTQLAATAVAMWISYLRGQRNVQLWTARSETRNERRRRVAAETAQRMQTMARALTTAADPAQVADAVFAALRDELRVDAATFALSGDRGRLRTLRRFGYRADEPIDGVLTALQPDGPVLGDNVALFVESPEDLRRQRPDLSAALDATRFRALAIVPLVVSDRTIGAVVVHWDHDREFADPDQSFLFTITGAAAQAVERARLTLTELDNLERSQHLHQLSSALAAATTPGDVAHAAIAGGRRALGAQSAVVPRPGHRRARPHVPRQQWPPGAALPRHGARGRQPCRILLHPRAHRRRHDRDRRHQCRGHDGGGRGAGAAGPAPAGDDRHRAAPRERRPARCPVPGVRGAGGADRARPSLPCHTGRADRTGAGAGPGLRARARGAARRRGSPRATVAALRGDAAVELESRAHHGDPADHEPRRGSARRLVHRPGACRGRARAPGRPRSGGGAGGLRAHQGHQGAHPLRLGRAGRRRVPHRADPAGPAEPRRRPHRHTR